MIEPFHRLFPDVAARESRVLHLREDGKAGAVPAGSYIFLESYCTNPDCNCERVVIDVVEKRKGGLASIDYYFNSPQASAYSDEPNPVLEPSSRQSEYAGAILALLKEEVIDETFNEHVRQHYQMVKSAARAFGFSSARDEGGVPTRRGEWAKQQRKQQKAARRRNRRR